MRVLGIDTSLRSTGYGVVEAVGTRLRSVECGTIRIPAARPHSECLVTIARKLGEVIGRARIDQVSIENVFYCKNIKTALILGQARGVVIATCAAAGLPVYEYEPRRMKQALVGYGGAQKDQVAKMVVRLLSLGEEPQEDAADALALAICHLHNQSSLAALRPNPV